MDSSCKACCEKRREEGNLGQYEPRTHVDKSCMPKWNRLENMNRAINQASPAQTFTRISGAGASIASSLCYQHVEGGSCEDLRAKVRFALSLLSGLPAIYEYFQNWKNGTSGTLQRRRRPLISLIIYAANCLGEFIDYRDVEEGDP